MIEQFRKARKRASISQRQIADAIGVSVQLISLYERGQMVPSFERMQELRQALWDIGHAKFRKFEELVKQV